MDKLFTSKSCDLDQRITDPNATSFQKTREKYRRRSVGGDKEEEKDVKKIEKRKSLEEKNLSETFNKIVNKMINKNRKSFYLSDVKIIETEVTGSSESEFDNLKFKPGADDSSFDLKTESGATTMDSFDVDHPSVLRYFNESDLRGNSNLNISLGDTTKQIFIE